VPTTDFVSQIINYHSKMGFKYQINYSLLKTVTVLLLFIFVGVLLTSCKSREKCPAYGEYRKFKVEQGY